MDELLSNTSHVFENITKGNNNRLILSYAWKNDEILVAITD